NPHRRPRARAPAETAGDPIPEHAEGRAVTFASGGEKSFPSACRRLLVCALPYQALWRGGRIAPEQRIKCGWLGAGAFFRGVAGKHGAARMRLHKTLRRADGPPFRVAEILVAGR